MEQERLLRRERLLRLLKSDRAVTRMANELAEGVLMDAVERGRMSVKGKSAEQILDEFRKHLPVKTLRSKSFSILFAIDHTGNLRALGREFLKKGDLWMAVVMYATWVEHTLNALVSIGLQRRRFSDATVKQVIRDVPFYGKLSWLLPVLGYGPLHPKHRETFKGLAEKRNEFVHYKWPYRKNHSDAEIEPLLTQTEKALQYLSQYKSRQTLKGRKSQIVKAVRLTLEPREARGAKRIPKG